MELTGFSALILSQKTEKKETEIKLTMRKKKKKPNTFPSTDMNGKRTLETSITTVASRWCQLCCEFFSGNRHQQQGDR